MNLYAGYFVPGGTDPMGFMAWYDRALQATADFSAGMADKITFGSTRTVRDNTGWGYTRYRSGSYRTGEYAGYAHVAVSSVAGGYAAVQAGRVAVAAGAGRAFAGNLAAGILVPQAANVGVSEALNAAASSGIITCKTAETIGAATSVTAELASAILAVKAINKAAKALDAPKKPDLVYRGGDKSPSNLTPRPVVDDGMLSVRDSLSNPYPLKPGQKPPLPVGKPIQVIDTSKLPVGSVVPAPDKIPGHTLIGPDVPAQTVKDAIIKTTPKSATR